MSYMPKIEDEEVKSPGNYYWREFNNLKYQLDAIRAGIDCVNKNNGVISC